MKKLLLAVIISAAFARAATTIQANGSSGYPLLVDAAGNPMTCALAISLNSGVNLPSGAHVPIGPIAANVQVTAGVFSVTLAANDTSTPVTNYKVNYNCTVPYAQSSEVWYVPTSGSPLTVAQVWIQTAGTPGIFIQPTQINGSGYTTGQVLGWTGSTFGPLTVPTLATENVSYVATPAFNPTASASTITLTGNVSGFSLAAGADGFEKTIAWCQDSIGGWTVSGAPGTIRSFPAFFPSAPANKCEVMRLKYNAALSAWILSGIPILNQ